MAELDLPDHEYLTVRELAELLRLKERKVYDLAASGAVPCSRATGKLLFPANEIRTWIARAQSGGGWAGQAFQAALAHRAWQSRPLAGLGDPPVALWAGHVA